MIESTPDFSGHDQRLRPRGSRLALLVALLLFAPACESDSATTGSSASTTPEQSNPEAPADDPPTADEPRISLSDENRQHIWRCAAQKSDVSRSKQLSVDPEILGAVRVALTGADDEEERYGRMRRNWNTDWDPDGVREWGVRWGHRGLEVHGRADSPRDVAEFLQRLQTSDATHLIELGSLESTGADEDSQVVFSLVEMTALDSARHDELFEEMLQRAGKQPVDDLVAEECSWVGEAPKFRPPSAYEDATWDKMDEVVTPLHRLHSWRAKVSDEPSKALEKLGEPPLKYAGVEVSPDGSGSTITLYSLSPRDDADFKPPGIPAPRRASKSPPWFPLVHCEADLCGETFDDAETEKRVRDLLEMSRRSGELRLRLRANDRLLAPQVSTRAFAKCLEQYVPVAAPSEEETTPEEHAKTQKDKRIRLRRLRIDKQHHELYFTVTESIPAARFPDALADCIESQDDMGHADVPAVDGGEQPYRAILSITPKIADSHLDLPPWNPNGNKAPEATIEAFASADGPKWKTWLRDDIATQQRQLLIAREKIPNSLDAARFMAQVDNVLSTFGARMTSLDYVGAAPREDIGVNSHRIELRASISAEAMPQVLEALSNMTRIVEPVLVEFEAGDGEAGTLTAAMNMFTYRRD